MIVDVTVLTEMGYHSQHLEIFHSSVRLRWQNVAHARRKPNLLTMSIEQATKDNHNNGQHKDLEFFFIIITPFYKTPAIDFFLDY